MQDNADILDSWKEIAVFLQRGIRTVQRWEQTEGLPVRRHHHLKRGSVYAVRVELVAWLRGRQLGVMVRSESHDLQQFRLLRMLATRQAVLAEELRQLLAVNADVRTRIRPFRPVGLAPVSSINSRIAV